MRVVIKNLLNLLCQLVVLPLAVLSFVEKTLTSGKSEVAFGMCTHIVAILPGIPGMFLRRAFYTLSLEKCSNHCHIGFGTIISHRCTVLDNHVYIGSYASIGNCHIGENSLIGSKSSILSGEALHELDEEGQWTPYSSNLLVRVNIAKNVWIGEGAIVSADVGESSMIGSGAVVTSQLKSLVMVAGNPARFVKKLEPRKSEAD